LATILDGKHAIGDEHGILALVEVMEVRSQRGKENAIAGLLQMCMNNNRHWA
jgi:vacuolar protein 8